MSEATEESILNALCQAETLAGFKGRGTSALDVERVEELLGKYMVRFEGDEVVEGEGKSRL